MSKIIGFLITKNKENPKINFFVELEKIVIKHGYYYIHLWGIGDLAACKVNNAFSLSFPLHDSLLDRNILIRLDSNEITIENDWLGSIPVFYNQKELIVSTIPNFCLKDKSIHYEGLANYCEFGYSVFEQTIYKDVKFMRYFSKLILTDQIFVETKLDPVLDDTFLDGPSLEEDVINQMKDYISNVEDRTNGDIILPISGGYDSRILSYFINQKSRIKSFTYGISNRQELSHEVVYAKEISNLFNTSWDHIELDNYVKHIGTWADLYGYSTHLHGMYHIEFYSKIINSNSFDNPTFLSGIFGDIWAGSINYEPISDYSDISNLGFTHQLNLDKKYLKGFENNEDLKRDYFYRHQEYLSNDKYKAVFTIRLKIILISYLTQIPEYFGFPVWTPFLNFKIAKATLNISEGRRENRIWQSNFFKKVGLNFEDMNLKSDKRNMLDFKTTRKGVLEKIDIDLMKDYFDDKRLKSINQELNPKLENILIRILMKIPIGVNMLLRMGWVRNYLNRLYDYYVIKAIEISMKK